VKFYWLYRTCKRNDSTLLPVCRYVTIQFWLFETSRATGPAGCRITLCVPWKFTLSKIWVRWLLTPQ